MLIRQRDLHEDAVKGMIQCNRCGELVDWTDGSWRASPTILEHKCADLPAQAGHLGSGIYTKEALDHMLDDIVAEMMEFLQYWSCWHQDQTYQEWLNSKENPT